MKMLQVSSASVSSLWYVGRIGEVWMTILRCMFLNTTCIVLDLMSLNRFLRQLERVVLFTSQWIGEYPTCEQTLYAISSEK